MDLGLPQKGKAGDGYPIRGVDNVGPVPTKKVAYRALKGANKRFVKAVEGADVVPPKKEVYNASEGDNNSAQTLAVAVTDTRSEAGVVDSDGISNTLPSDLECSEMPCSDLVRSVLGVLDGGLFLRLGHEAASSDACVPKEITSDDDVHAASGVDPIYDPGASSVPDRSWVPGVCEGQRLDSHVDGQATPRTKTASAGVIKMPTTTTGAMEVFGRREAQVCRNETAVSWVLNLVAAGSREGLQGNVQATPRKRTVGGIVQTTLASASSGIIKEGSDFGVPNLVDDNNISRMAGIPDIVKLLATVSLSPIVSKEIGRRVSSIIVREGVVLDFQPPVRSSDPTRSDSVRHVWVVLSVCTQGRGCDVRSRFPSEGVNQIKICLDRLAMFNLG